MATRAAFEVALADVDHELEIRVGLLTALRGVGVGVASALVQMAPDHPLGRVNRSFCC